MICVRPFCALASQGAVIRYHYRASIADAGDLVARIVRLVDMQSKPLTASALAKLADFHVGER